MSSAYRKPDTCRQHQGALNDGMAYSDRARPRRLRIRRIRVAALAAVIAAIAASLGYHVASSSSRAASPLEVLRREQGGAAGEALPSTVWPAHGQAAFVETGRPEVQAGPSQHAAPIASVAKVMTAFLLLRDHPLPPGQDGPTITLSDADVADTDRRRGQQESVVSIAAGEQLTERQALQALLLPSANNIAAVLARWEAGSAERFVARMNATARSLGMAHTRYTDPSGYDDATVSTAADQLRIVDRAMRLPAFASIVATPSATLPVAGTVHNTNTLLGHEGFVGVKTGSDDAAGGCFAFRAIRWIDGKRATITGVVLGQPGHDRIAAALGAAAAMADRIAGHPTLPGPTHPRSATVSDGVSAAGTAASGGTCVSRSALGGLRQSGGAARRGTSGSGGWPRIPLAGSEPSSRGRSGAAASGPRRRARARGGARRRSRRWWRRSRAR
jgi:D-alanyl-D-alanine carboxypeptidase (penicillin-binding protein 5/6)